MSSNDLHTLTQKNDSAASISKQSSSKKRKRSYAWLLPVGLLLGFAAVLLLLFGKRFLPATEVQTERVITVRTTPSKKTTETPTKPKEATSSIPTKGAMQFQASGWVEPDPYTIYVPTLTDGVVKHVHVLEGQAVKKNDLLAELVDDDAKLVLASAKQKHASLKKRIVAHCVGMDIIDAEIVIANRKIATSEARKAEAQDALDRFNKLSRGVVSEQQKIRARLKLQEIKSETNELRSEIPRLEAKKLQINAEREAMETSLSELKTQRDIADLAFKRTKIYAPVDGIVLHLHAAPGKKRIMGMDDPKSAVIVELYNPNKLQARIDVPLNEAAAIRLQQVVELRSDLLPDRIFTGRVTRITGQADLQRNTLQAKVEIDNPDPRLRPDMLVRAKFFATGNSAEGETRKASDMETNQRSERLSIFVPEKAIFDKQFVWVISTKHTAEVRKITLGNERKENYLHVIDGVKSGERVILPPFDKLKQDSRVRLSNK